MVSTKICRSAQSMVYTHDKGKPFQHVFVGYSKGYLFRYLTSFHDGGRYHIETSPLIYRANQWTGFYMTGTSVTKERVKPCCQSNFHAEFSKLTHFFTTFLFLYPLKTWENYFISDVFQGYRKKQVARNGLNHRLKWIFSMKTIFFYKCLFFLFAVWLLRYQLWGIIEGTASPTQR